MSALDPEYVVPIGTHVALSRCRPPAKPAGMQQNNRQAMERVRAHYRLTDASGRYLHMGVFDQFVERPADAWIGNAAQLQRLRARHPETRNLTVVMIPRLDDADKHARRIR